ncbi:hypothetical protein [Bacillus multifaciens]|uniref:hypothetical protein n=1 Tax=Bacillus multifaciens TaxID=3068506 RepID=UPI002740E3F1|nr:hypothetical protein [Bacillus sp. WLY-B-L8]MDP7977738.1 hypothetical protein [Bacillus sp. WLY-B-L8]
MSKVYVSNIFYQKAKDTENKIKEKVYYVKNTIQQSISQTKDKFYRNKKRNRIGYCGSIATAILIMVASWLTATNWLFWIGVVSILSNALLYCISFIKR